MESDPNWILKQGNLVTPHIFVFCVKFEEPCVISYVCFLQCNQHYEDHVLKPKCQSTGC